MVEGSFDDKLVLSESRILCKYRNWSWGILIKVVSRAGKEILTLFFHQSDIRSTVLDLETTFKRDRNKMNCSIRREPG